MSHLLLLDWATMAFSLFNAIVLLWLGGTVLLNADRRTWGIWLAAVGLLLGGAFFISHSAILGLDLTHLSRSLRFWWYLGLAPVVLLPLGWYVVVLWYAGYWNDRSSHLYRRQRGWLIMVLAAALAGLSAVVIYANPMAESLSLLPLRLPIQRFGGTPLLVVGYAVYLLTCFGLALDALLRPGPTQRAMGDQARQRARGWLILATLLLSAVSVLVIGVLLWVLLNVRQGSAYIVTEGTLATLARFDLLVSSLITAAILALGQAVVAYEIFTGKTLPRSGLRRQWRLALLMAAGYGGLVGAVLVLQQRPIYGVLLSVLFMTAFFALLSWRSYSERERYMAHLRPFVSSQHLYDHLLSMPQDQSSAGERDGTQGAGRTVASQSFEALCRDVLGARLAYLAPWGPMAPLAGGPLVYAQGRAPDRAQLPPLQEVIARFGTPQTAYVDVDPSIYGGAVWAVSLWSARGLAGVLLLGQKEDGGVYTQEEMEIARASCERLLDVRASAEVAQRLLVLQRQRLAESQVADRRTRRILHDDVLPQVHAALLALGSRNGQSEDGSRTQTSAANGEARALLTDVHRLISDLLRDTPPAVTPEVARLGALGALQQAVLHEFANRFDDVVWEADEVVVARSRMLAPTAAEVLFYAAREALRNAAQHGHRAGELRAHIRAYESEDNIVVEVEDDGVGIVSDARSRTTREGHGLALHSTMMAVVGGTLELDSAPGAYTRVRLVLPLLDNSTG